MGETGKGWTGEKKWAGHPRHHAVTASPLSNCSVVVAAMAVSCLV